MRHLVNVMRPTGAEGDLGERRGQPICVRREVPCSIETLTGREIDQARTILSDAIYKVEFYADPSKVVTQNDFLTGGTLGKRELHIGYVNDVNMQGLKLELLCGEAREPRGNN
jgi:hypothetical protein